MPAELSPPQVAVTVASEDSYRVAWVGRNNVTHSRLFDSKDAADWFAKGKRHDLKERASDYHAARFMQAEALCTAEERA